GGFYPLSLHDALPIWIYFLTAPDTGGLNRGDLWTLITAVVFGGHIVAVSEFSKRFDAQRLVWLQLPGTALGTLIAALLLEQLRLDRKSTRLNSSHEWI